MDVYRKQDFLLNKKTIVMSKSQYTNMSNQILAMNKIQKRCLRKALEKL